MNYTTFIFPIRLEKKVTTYIASVRYEDLELIKKIFKTKVFISLVELEEKDKQ